MSNNNIKSYSASLRTTLKEAEIKKKCCRRTFHDTCDYLSQNIERVNSLREILDHVKCEKCIKEFIAAAFIHCGSITDPEKRNHLDFIFSDSADQEAVADALITSGFEPKLSTRRGRPILYFKDNDTISDLLAYLGATKAAFDVMNSKIMKEIRNNANRQVNCDTANIEKAISASQKYVDAISFLSEHGGLEALPGELFEAAELRINNPQSSLSELGSKCSPPITKSGMKHRLEKLISAAEDLKSRLNQNI